MPPTFLLYFGALVLAALAPVVAIVLFALLFKVRWRSIALRALRWATVGGVAVCTGWFAVVLFLGSIPSDGATIAVGIFGAGFSVGALALAVLLAGGVLSNSSSSRPPSAAAETGTLARFK